MTKLTHNLGIKVLACFFIIIAGFSAALSGAGVYYASENDFFGSNAKPYHETRLCQNVTYDYAVELIDYIDYGDWALSYKKQEFSPENTNFRYILKDEKGTPLWDNMTDGENAAFADEYLFVLSNQLVTDSNGKEVVVGLNDSRNVILECYVVDPPVVSDDYQMTFLFHQTLYDMSEILLPILLASILVFAASLIYLLCAAGHQAGKEEITPNLQDKIPLDLYLATSCGVGLLVGLFALDGNSFRYTAEIIVGVGSILLLAMLGLATLLTCVTRLKLGRYFYQNTIVYKVIRICWKVSVAVFTTCIDAFKSIPSVWKVAVAWLVISSVYLSGGFGALLMNLLLMFVFCAIAAQLQKLKTGGEQLAKGNLEYKIDTKRMFSMFRSHGDNLNSISKGFSIALNQKIKSERMKTELITNVSHDIKTPLTSIINYVDLLKKEGLEGQAAEYIEVLDRQSRRLKKLTEDLVEASKASTGNLKVNLAPTDMGELVAQAAAEYEEKLEKSKLEVIINGMETPVFAMVDGNLTWRVLSNLLSNACKYSQTGTRVYIDIKNEKDFVIVSMKNISKDALNIPVDELMERFVRGDSSRHTEGSGLGLNIAQSLVGLQKGKFSLEIDGDMFKAHVKFPAAEPPAPPAEEVIDKTDTTEPDLTIE